MEPTPAHPRRSLARRPGGLAALLVLLFAWWSAGAAAQEISPYGINVHAPAGEQLALLDRVEEAGIGWIRIDMVWAAVERQPGKYDWKLYDRLVAAAEERGLQVLAILAYTPKWATSGAELSGVPRDGADWRRFCTRAATRYRGRIRYWELWNEPNLPRFWSGTRQQYWDLILVPGAAAIRAADPQAKIVGPALAHVGSADWHHWLLQTLERAGSSIDVVSHHLYDGDGHLDLSRKLDGSTPFANQPSLWGAVPPSVREVLKRADARDKPFWLTETGWQSGNGAAAQAANYTGFLGTWLAAPAEPAAWIEKVFFYELADGGPELSWGLLDTAGREKPAYGAYRDFIAAHPAAPPLLLQGGRFALSIAWRDHAGRSGGAQPVNASAESGWFWFFTDDNLEVLVKVLDGSFVNGNAWLFWGALSDVEYWLTVTDRSSGETRRYHSPLGTVCGGTDATSFPWLAAPASFGAPALAAAPDRAVAARASDLGLAAAAGACVPGPTTACVGGGRFRIEAEWHLPATGARGAASAAGIFGDSAAFTFFDPENLELAAKVLDGRVFNGRYWVFFGALSDVEYWLTVTDTTTGLQRRYHNPAGTLCGRADVEAF
jgi:polysaccharide biosynthesis protein PslG